MLPLILTDERLLQSPSGSGSPSGGVEPPEEWSSERDHGLLYGDVGPGRVRHVHCSYQPAQRRVSENSQYYRTEMTYASTNVCFEIMLVCSLLLQIAEGYLSTAH